MANEEDAQALLTKIAYQDLEGLKGLIASGVDINAQDDMQGNTALIAACTYGFTDIAKYLISEGADVDEASDTGPGAGYTCLMMVARNANPELVKFLLSKGADINAKAKDGSTALSLAMKENEAKMVALLKANGATE